MTEETLLNARVSHAPVARVSRRRHLRSRMLNAGAMSLRARGICRGGCRVLCKSRSAQARDEPGLDEQVVREGAAAAWHCLVVREGTRGQGEGRGCARTILFQAEHRACLLCLSEPLQATRVRCSVPSRPAAPGLALACWSDQQERATSSGEVGRARGAAAATSCRSRRHGRLDGESEREQRARVAERGGECCS